jgi:lycopene beta-cyclase
MTYFGFLFRFLAIPLLVLLAFAAWDIRRGKTQPCFQTQSVVWMVIGLHVLLAVLYTTPWDNYLVATGVWSYNPRLISGLLVGWVPVEEYFFFVLETLLTGLWWWFLAYRIPLSTTFHSSKTLRLYSLGCAALIWLLAVFILAWGWKPGTYLALIFTWALPALAPQLFYGADILWRHRKLIALAVFPMFFYLSATDSLAITSGTWRIDPTQSTGIFIGRLPIEEALFFGITVTLITFGLTLALSPFTQVRWKTWLAQVYQWSAAFRKG